MSNYDLVAISSHPDFYLSSNSLTDQSGQTLYPLTNTANNAGQPIIVGNPSSFLIDNTHNITIGNNPLLFRLGSYFEFTAYFPEPQDSMTIFSDVSGENGLFISTSGIELRFTDGADVVNSVSVPVDTWQQKFYIVVTFDRETATLHVNNRQKSTSFTAKDPSSIGQFAFVAPVGYQYSVDGIGVYSLEFTKKGNFLDALTFGYPVHISKWYGAISTDLISNHIAESYTISRSEFAVSDINNHVFMQMLPPGFEYGFISIESDTDLPITYQVNEDTPQVFVRRAIVTAAQAAQYIRFTVNSKAQEFTVTINVHEAGIVDMLGPARLSVSGGAFFPKSRDIVLVNCKQGIRFSGGYFSGEWIDESPKSIEIVFKPLSTSTTHVFASSDGNATYGTSGSVNGYAAWLNGVQVNNLNNVITNEWNHLVLTINNPTATTFNLNATALGNSAGDIEYLFLAAYPTVVQLVPELYSMISSSYKMTHSETLTSQVHEGEGDPDSPFSIYSMAWAIIGGGGS